MCICEYFLKHLLVKEASNKTAHVIVHLRHALSCHVSVFCCSWEFLWGIFFVSSLRCWQLSIHMHKSNFHIVWTLRRSFGSFNEMSPKYFPSVLSYWSLKVWSSNASANNERETIIEFRTLSHSVSEAEKAFKSAEKGNKVEVLFLRHAWQDSGKATYLVCPLENLCFCEVTHFQN